MELFEWTIVGELGRDLSKGMRQSIDLLALSSRPQVLFFDEPMIGLES